MADNSDNYAKFFKVLGILASLAVGGYTVYSSSVDIISSYPSSEDVPLKDRTLYTGVFLLATAFIETSESNNDGGDIFIFHVKKDAVPYSAVEARAAEIYGVVHCDEKARKLKFPAIIAEDSATGAALKDIFADCGASGMLNKLNVYEKLLEHEDGKTGAQPPIGQ